MTLNTPLAEPDEQRRHAPAGVDQADLDLFELYLQAVEAVLGRLPGRIVTAVRSGVLEYRENEALTPGLERVTEAVLRHYLAFARGRDPSSRGLCVVREVVARRADDGVPLEALQDALCVGRAIVSQALVEAKGGFRGQPGAQRSFEALDQALDDFTALLSEDIAGAYETRRAETAAARAERVACLFRGVLMGELPAGVHDEPEGGPIANLSTPQTLYLARRADDGDLAGLRDAVARVKRAVLVPMPDSTVPHAVVLIAGDGGWPSAGAAAAANAGLLILSAGRCETPRALHRRYARSRVLLPFLPRVAEPGPPADFDDLRAYELAAGLSADTRLDIVDEVLGKLLAQPKKTRDSLLTTVEAVVEHSARSANLAAALGADKRTAGSHLKSIQSLTRQRLDSSLGITRLVEAFCCFRLEGSPGL
jgi:hypothetical protein